MKPRRRRWSCDFLKIYGGLGGAQSSWGPRAVYHLKYSGHALTPSPTIEELRGSGGGKERPYHH